MAAASFYSSHAHEWQTLHAGGQHAQQTKLQCRNCNMHGHVFRNCNSPTISYGIIAARVFRVANSSETGAERKEVRYLLIQRRDSLSFIDFVRGKYHPQNLAYLQQLFRSMTDDERALVSDPATDFAALWATVWHRPIGSHQGHEYAEARASYESLREGYLLRTGGGEAGGAVTPVSLAALVATTESAYPTEREWGFPKGRRKVKEPDAAAAVREFSEETLYAPTDIELVPGCKPIDETFQGTNGVRYRHVYFVARMREGVAEPVADARNVREQAREVREVRWCTRDEVLARMRPHNVERRHLFCRVADMMEKNV